MPSVMDASARLNGGQPSGSLMKSVTEPWRRRSRMLPSAPYSIATDRLLGFLRDVVEPFLRIFRRFAPRLGGLDFSPMLAIISLYLVNIIVVQGIIS